MSFAESSATRSTGSPPERSHRSGKCPRVTQPHAGSLTRVMPPRHTYDPTFRSPAERRWKRLTLLCATLLAVGALALAVAGIAFVLHSLTETSIEDSARAQWEQQIGLTTRSGGGTKDFGDCAVVELDGPGARTVVLIRRHGQWALAGANAGTAAGHWDLDSVDSRDECRAHADALFVVTA